jgi:hypothetical protein
MEGLAVFGIVCNVIQVVDFGLKTISEGREIYKNGASTDVLDAEMTSRNLIDLSSELTKSLPAVASGTKRTLDQQVQELAINCSAAATELAREIAKLKPDQAGKKWKAFIKLMETIWKNGKIEQLQNTLERCRRTLDTVLLTKLM